LIGPAFDGGKFGVNAGFGVPFRVFGHGLCKWAMNDDTMTDEQYLICKSSNFFDLKQFVIGCNKNASQLRCIPQSSM